MKCPVRFLPLLLLIVVLAVVALQSSAFTTVQSHHRHPTLPATSPTTTTTTTVVAASKVEDDIEKKKEKKETTKATTKAETNNNHKKDQASSSSSSSFSSFGSSFRDRVSNSGVASAAAMATAAVNAAVAMKSLEAPQVEKSFIARNTDNKQHQQLDEEGLPLVYDKDLIQQYWSGQRGALNQRWGTFVGKAVPFLTKLVTLFIREGSIPEREIPALSRQARQDLQDLGPTFIKAGQMMSVRPDVLPPATLEELTKLQDAVVPFDTQVAVEQIERELGGPLGQFFTSISEEPVAAASLAQVYLATLNDGKDTKVAVKVQRPSVLGTVSKDLYVLRRAAEVFQGLVERFAPQQRTNYVALLNEWAIGFYTELDFQNEAQNQQRLRTALIEKGIQQVKVPMVYPELCTRRLLVSEWMDGKKLSDASTEEIARVTPFAQEAFLTQLFELGFFHADPHPGNLLLLNKSNKEDVAELALIDCGLMASITSQDRDYFINAVIHLANKDYASLVDDFMLLQILPTDSDRAAIIPLMDKALSPYVKGGGAKKYEAELKRLYGMQDGNMQSTVGGFQSMTQDALTVLNDIPFSIPPYFAILGRAIVTLEGIALTGNPDYGIIMEAYPFIARKLLREDRPEIQAALQQVLYSSSAGQLGGNGENGDTGLKLSRLLALLNNAAGAVATKEGAAFVDIDAVPQDGITFQQGIKFVLSDNAESLRRFLEPEVDSMVDIVTRQILRKGLQEALVSLTPPRPPALPFLGDIFPPSPKLDEIPIPLVLPSAAEGGRPGVAIVTLQDLMGALAPKLDQQEELYALGLADATSEFLGADLGNFVRGESIWSVKTAELILAGLRSGVLGKIITGSGDVLSPEATQRIVEASTNILSSVRGSGSSTTTTMEKELVDALDSLDTTERERLDSIIEQITQRTVKRALKRLSSIDRVI